MTNLVPNGGLLFNDGAIVVAYIRVAIRPLIITAESLDLWAIRGLDVTEVKHERIQPIRRGALHHLLPFFEPAMDDFIAHNHDIQRIFGTCEIQLTAKFGEFCISLMGW